MIKVGDKFLTNNYGEVEVVEYKSFHEIVVVFSCGTEKTVYGGNLRKGEVSPKKSKRSYKTVYDYLKNREEYSRYSISYCNKYEVHFTCSVCDNDMYSVLYPNGKLFKVSVNCFKEGKIPCRCNKMFAKTDDEWRVYFTNHMGDKGDLISLERNKFNRRMFNWVCNKGHNVLTNASDNISKKSGCPVCYKGYKDTLYLVKLIKPDGECYTKLGVTKNLDYRLKMYEDEGLSFTDLYCFKTIDVGVTNAMDLEKKILDVCKKYKLNSSGLVGYTGYTEVLPAECYVDLLNIFHIIQRDGDFIEYEIKDFLTSGVNQ